VPLLDGEVPQADPATLGLCEGAGPGIVTICNRENRANRATEPTERKEHTEETEANRDTEAIVRFVVDVRAPLVETAIARTLPSQYGSRNRHLFKLARALRAIPDLSRIPKSQVRLLKPIVQEWYRRARANMLTKDFGETWGDFAHAWGQVRHPEGADVLGDALKAARAAPCPVWATEYADGQQLLGALCRELQRRAGEQAFFLGAATAGRCAEVDKVTAWRWLRAFEADGAIVEVVKGSHKSGRASRYRYTGDDL
jgi:hypothetical protein